MEVKLKGEFLNAAIHQDTDLFETILLQIDGSLLWLKEHLMRMKTSARQLDYPFSQGKAMAVLRSHLEGSDTGPAVVRLVLAKRGDMTVEILPLSQADQGPKRLIVSREKTDPDDRLLRHKTTRRKMYDRELAGARSKGCVYTLFTNTRGRITEGAITNVFVLVPEGWKTPDVTCGLLPGIWREKFIQASGALPCELKLTDLSSATHIVIGNSVRGSMEINEVAGSEGQILYKKQDPAEIDHLAHSFSTSLKQLL
jgi:branched-subunit amino acid aminotransferase/4-amino-4-deoxychorismate lyase